MFGGDASAIRAGRNGRAHHGFAGLAHDGAHVFKVDVDMAGHIDDFGNTADGIFQHIVGMGKRLILRDIVTQHVEQFFIQHHDQRINIGFQLGQTAIGVGHAATAFKFERLGDHAHGQDAHFTRHAGNDRCRTGACAAAHAGGDEQHVRAGNGRTNVINGQLGRFATFVRLAAGTQTAGAELNGFVRIAAAQGLRVGIGADKFNALHAAADHVTHGIAAAAANTDHLDLRALVKSFFFHHFNRHF